MFTRAASLVFQAGLTGDLAWWAGGGRIAVKSKTDNDNLICYCYGYSAGAIARDAATHGHSTILARIQEAKRSNACHCERANPYGR